LYISAKQDQKITYQLYNIKIFLRTIQRKIISNDEKEENILKKINNNIVSSKLTWSMRIW